VSLLAGLHRRPSDLGCLLPFGSDEDTGQLPLRWELTHPFSSPGHPLGPGHSTRTTTATSATRTRGMSGTIYSGCTSSST